VYKGVHDLFAKYAYYFFGSKVEYVVISQASSVNQSRDSPKDLDIITRLIKRNGNCMLENWKIGVVHLETHPVPLTLPMSSEFIET